MKLTVRQNQIWREDEIDFVTTGNVESITCDFNFDQSYSGLDLFAVFYRDKTLNRMVELDKGSCVIPWELLESAGNLYVGAYGTKTDGNTVEKRMTTNFAVIRVVNSLSSETVPNAAPSPDVWETYRAQILSMREKAQEYAQQSAASASETFALYEQVGLWQENAEQDAATALEYGNKAYEYAALAKQYKEQAQGIKESTEIIYDIQPNKVGFRRSNETNFTYTGDLTGPQGPRGESLVNITAEQTGTGTDITITDRDGADTTVHIDTLIAVNTWADIRNAVRLGLGEKLFPVGHEFTTHDADTGAEIVWVVRGHDHHQAANTRLTHSMTLETKYVYSNAAGAFLPLQYDAVEALYYAAEGLAPGTYHFTAANQSAFAVDNGKSYQFTLAQAVPAGGQIVLNAAHNQTLEGKTASTFAGPASVTAIETVTLTEGSGGTSLDGTDGINNFYRMILGSSNYAQSAARQWLNSAAAAGSVWAPATKFDRPPSWAATYNGFLHGLPEDFLEVVQPAAIPCRTNSVYETASLDGTAFALNQVYTLKDKFFLLSRPEVYGTWYNTSCKDGEVLEYYSGLTDPDRIKRDAAGMALGAWLRSPNPGAAYYERVVNTNGGLDHNFSRGASGIAPACIIA